MRDMILHFVLGEGYHSKTFSGCYRGKPAAIKRLKKNGKNSYAKEVAILGKLDHKNILKLLHPAMLYIGQRFYLVMELAEGGDLAVALKKKRSLPWKTSVVLQLVSAVEYLHQQTILHCDLKPSNIFFRDKRQTQVLIGDFGKASQSVSVNIKGPFLFRAPEKIYTAKSDIYSIGFIFCCVFANVNPSDTNVVIQCRKDLLHNVGPIWCAFIRQACAIEPEKRPTAERLGANLKNYAISPAAKTGQLQVQAAEASSCPDASITRGNPIISTVQPTATVNSTTTGGNQDVCDGNVGSSARTGIRRRFKKLKCCLF